MPRSMTGFARTEKQFPWGQLICEVRSVNHRYLEPSFRLSEVFRSLEARLRETLRKKVGRGKVEAVLALKLDDSQDSVGDFNRDTAEALIKLAREISDSVAKPAPINPLEILRWPGVLKAKELDSGTLEAEGMKLFQETINNMIANREREGAELSQLLQQRLQGIQTEVAKLREQLPTLLQAQEEKIRTKLEALQVEVDEDRLSQELVYLAQKSDVAEELDRLDAHVVEAGHILKQKEPIGRRLDFLMQEFNREANTLSSKSISKDCTQSAVEIKVLIEQMREQVQNIE